MQLHLSTRRKRGALIAVLAVFTAMLAAIPLRAHAEDGAAVVAFSSANLTVTVRQASAGGGAIRYTVRVLNNGPDDLLDGDYRVSLDWSAGTVVGGAGDSGCFELSDHGCVIDGPAVQFFEGPVVGPGSVDLQITANIPDRIFFINIVEINFSQVVNPFPDFGLQPPVQCAGNNCSSI